MLPITDPSATHICSGGPMANASVLAGRCTGPTVLEMEIEMTSKIGAIFVAVALIGSAGVASAQSARHAAHQVQIQAPDAGYYHFRGSPPAARQIDPLAGTVFEGVAPY
jgi:hypothetical protein